MGRTPKAGPHCLLHHPVGIWGGGRAGGRAVGGPTVTFTPTGFGVPGRGGGCARPRGCRHGRAVRRVPAVGSPVEFPRGRPPLSLPPCQPQIEHPPLPTAATAGGGPPCPQAGGGDRRVTSGRTPGGRNESRGTGTHPLGDGAAPGALPLLPCVDDLLDADGLAFLTIPAGGQASALLAPHYAHESPRLTSWAPHKPPLASWDPTHPPWNPREPPPTLRSPHSPSQDATRLHRTPQDPTRPFEPRLILTGLHLPSWDPIHLHRTPLAFTRPQGGPPPTLTSPRSPSQDPTHPCGPHLPSRTPRRTPFALTGSPRPHGIPHRPPTCPHRTPHKPQFSLVGSHLLSRDPTHPYRPPLTLIGPYSPSRNPTCPHGTLLALMGPH